MKEQIDFTKKSFVRAARLLPWWASLALSELSFGCLHFAEGICKHATEKRFLADIVAVGQIVVPCLFVAAAMISAKTAQEDSSVAKRRKDAEKPQDPNDPALSPLARAILLDLQRNPQQKHEKPLLRKQPKILPRLEESRRQQVLMREEAARKESNSRIAIVLLLSTSLSAWLVMHEGSSAKRGVVLKRIPELQEEASAPNAVSQPQEIQPVAVMQQGRLDAQPVRSWKLLGYEQTEEERAGRNAEELKTVPVEKMDGATEQKKAGLYKWTDKNGVVHYSNIPANAGSN